ncbi:MAG: zinc-ribbon domain-containing protein [Gammaproteobacteria bacterium]|nr:zinc-ribbon domain-containing protein [Gammaproteobacteria bacterium]
MNRLLEILSKLGILRYGAGAGTYRNATEAPDELMDIYTNKSGNKSEDNGGSTMFCPKCGAELQGDSKFCSSCGAEITTTTNTTAQQAQPQVAVQPTAAEPKKKSKIGRILMWVGIFIVAIFRVRVFGNIGTGGGCGQSSCCPACWGRVSSL